LVPLLGEYARRAWHIERDTENSIKDTNK